MRTAITTAAAIVVVCVPLLLTSASADLSVRFTEFAKPSTYDDFAGVVEGIDSSTPPLKAALYVYWTTPKVWSLKRASLPEPAVAVAANGTFRFHSWRDCWRDYAAMVVAVYVMPQSAAVPKAQPVCEGGTQPTFLPAELGSISLAHVRRGRGTFSWMGFDTWTLRNNTECSANPQDVWIDQSTQALHMTVHKVDGAWKGNYMNMVGTHLGYGTYSWQLATNMYQVTKSHHAIWAAWTYDERDDAVASANREIDFEFYSYNSTTYYPGSNVQAVVQPWDGANQRLRWAVPSDAQSMTVVWRWQPGMVRFWGFRGLHVAVAGDDPVAGWPASDVVMKWNVSNATAKVFVPGAEDIKMSVGTHGYDVGYPIEVVIPKFQYFPLDSVVTPPASRSETSAAPPIVALPPIILILALLLRL